MRARIFLALFLAAGAAQAAFTSVNAHGNGDGGERCLAGAACTAGSYAGALSIVAAFERDLGLAAGSVQRIDDAFDRLWVATAADAAFRPFARYAGDRSALGISGGGASPIRKLKDFSVWVDHRRLFSGVREHGDFRRNRFPWYELAGAADAPFAFVLHNFSSSLRLSSDPSLAGFSNSGLAQDWMVSYRVPGENLYLLAFEDRARIGANGLPNDYDYNDFVFIVRGAAPVMVLQEEPPASPVPLPPAFVSLLLGLASLAFLAFGPGGPGLFARRG